MNSRRAVMGPRSISPGRREIRAYCGGEPTAALYGRMVNYKAMCDLLWTLWA